MPRKEIKKQKVVHFEPAEYGEGFFRAKRHSSDSESEDESIKKIQKVSTASGLAASRTKLHRAVLNEKSSSVRDILKSQPSLTDVQDRDGNTALHLAVKLGLKVLKMLLDARANTRLQNGDEHTPLHCALVADRMEAAMILLDYDGKIDLQDAWGRTPLHVAAERRNLTVLRKLIDAGVDTSLKEQNDRTALHCALYSTNEHAAKVLVEHSLSTINVQDRDGRSPLHAAAQRGYVGIVRRLLDLGADPRLLDNDLNTPLQFALDCRSGGAANVLVEIDGENEVLDAKGLSPLSKAVREGYETIVQKILFWDVHPHVMDKRGRYPLNFALNKWYIAEVILSMIAMRGIDIDIKHGWKLGFYPAQMMYYEKVLEACYDEIQRMKATKVHGSDISYHDLVKKGVREVAFYLGKEDIRKNWAGFTQNFPIYEDLINFKVGRAEKRISLTAQCLDCFSVLSSKLSSLPEMIVEDILLYLNERDLTLFKEAFQINNKGTKKSTRLRR